MQAAKARGDRIVICDIPLLFEKKLQADYDVIVLVDAPKEVRLERLTTRRGMPRDDAMHMIAAQMPAELKRAQADFVIENDSDQRASVAEGGSKYGRRWKRGREYAIRRKATRTAVSVPRTRA